MNINIESALLNNGYNSIYTNISEASFFVKNQNDLMDVVILADGNNDNMTPDVYNNIVKQVKDRYKGLGKACRCTGFISCTMLNTAAPICEAESEDDRRYAVLKNTDEIVLFEFQSERKDEHIALINNWKNSSKTHNTSGAPDIIERSDFARKSFNANGSNFARNNSANNKSTSNMFSGGVRQVKSNYRNVKRKANNLPFDLTLCNVAIILINIIAFIILASNGNTEDAQYLEESGGLLWSDIVDKNQYYRFFTSMFMHAGFEHLAGNMFSLFFIGGYLEKYVGHAKYLLIYFTSGILAGVTSVLYNMMGGDQIVCVGASGAIFGVMGALVAALLLSNSRRSQQDMYRLGAYVVLCILSGISSQEIDNAAHIGGCIAGFLCAFALLKMYPGNKNYAGRNSHRW